MPNPGLFLTFEGSEGCGKSTQIRILAQRLRAMGHMPLVLREPGGTPSGEVIRHLLKHAPEGAELFAESELLLFAASRAQLVREMILPALAEGRIVVSDRFLDSTTVYQGVARRIPRNVTDHLNHLAVGSCLPQLTFLLDLDLATARNRMAQRELTLDRIEREPEEFFQSVRAGYLALALEAPGRIKVLDASQSEAQIAEDIWQHLIESSGSLFSQ